MNRRFSVEFSSDEMSEMNAAECSPFETKIVVVFL